MAVRRSSIAFELLTVALVIGALGATVAAVIAIEKHAPRPLPPQPITVVAEALPRFEPEPDSTPKPPIAPPAPPRPVPALVQQVIDPTPEVVAKLKASGERERTEAAAAAATADDLELARQKVDQERKALVRQELQARAKLDELNKKAKRAEDQVATYELERDVLAIELDSAKAALDKAKNRSSHAVVPHRGPNGTWQRPIVIECSNGEAKFAPNGMSFSLVELGTVSGLRNNRFASAVAKAAILTQRGSAPDGNQVVPYVFFLVRPDGIRPFYEARAALQGLGIAFGYELIDQDWEVEVPDLDDPSEWMNEDGSKLKRQENSGLTNNPRSGGPAVARSEIGRRPGSVSGLPTSNPAGDSQPIGEYVWPPQRTAPPTSFGTLDPARATLNRRAPGLIAQVDDRAAARGLLPSSDGPNTNPAANSTGSTTMPSGLSELGSAPREINDLRKPAKPMLRSGISGTNASNSGNLGNTGKPFSASDGTGAGDGTGVEGIGAGDRGDRRRGDRTGVTGNSEAGITGNGETLGDTGKSGATGKTGTGDVGSADTRSTVTRSTGTGNAGIGRGVGTSGVATGRGQSTSHSSNEVGGDTWETDAFGGGIPEEGLDGLPPPTSTSAVAPVNLSTEAVSGRVGRADRLLADLEKLESGNDISQGIEGLDASTADALMSGLRRPNGVSDPRSKQSSELDSNELPPIDDDLLPLIPFNDNPLVGADRGGSRPNRNAPAGSGEGSNDARPNGNPVKMSGSAGGGSSAMGGQPPKNGSTDKPENAPTGNSQGSPGGMPQFGNNDSPAGSEPKRNRGYRELEPAPRPTRNLEIQLVCQPDGILIYPGAYRLTKAALEADPERLPRQLAAILNLQELKYLEIRWRPSIVYKIATGGESTYWEARKQTVISAASWPSRLEMTENSTTALTPGSRFPK